MQEPSRKQSLSIPDLSTVDSLEPVLENTILYFDGKAVGLAIPERDRILFQNGTEHSPVDDVLGTGSFARQVEREEGLVEDEPGAAEERLFNRYDGSNEHLNWSAGVPVGVYDRRVAGVLMVMGERNEPLSDSQRRYLRNVSRQISSRIEQEMNRADAEKRRDMSETVLKNAYQFMGALSSEGEILFGNKSALDFQEIALEEVVGLSLWKSPWFDHSEQVRDDVREGVEKAKKGEFVQFETTTSASDGRIVWIDFSLTPVTGEDGEVSNIVAEGRDISDRVQLERELKRTNRRLRAIEEYAPVGISLGDPEGNVLTWNPECEEIFGFSEEEAVGGVPPFLTEDRNGAYQEILETVRDGGKVESREVEWERKSGESVVVRTSVAPVTDASGAVCNIVSIFNDVTKQKKTEEQLDEQERLFQKLIENIREVFYLVSPDNREQIYISPGIEEIWGRSVEELKQERWRWMESVHEQDRDRVKQAVMGQPEEPLDIEYRIVQPDGTVRWVHDTSYPIENSEGEIMMMGGICEDITQYREVRENLEQSLREKEMLLEELHHRVKNNLQIILSLMNLQLHRIPDGAQEPVEDIISQVYVIAKLHETLYKSEDLTDLKFEDYLCEITKRLTSLFADEQVSVDVDVTSVTGPVELKRAVPCGLIVNELVSNALKHAFDGKPGRVVVSLEPVDQDGENRFQLCVSDNGIGLPPEVDPEDPDRFGLQLVRMMTEGELNGTYSVRRNDGTTFCIQFRMD